MKIKTINLYQFHELTEEQQAKVLEKYRYLNDDIFESYANDEYNTLEIIESGFNNPTIHYSLGYCQGSGACFDCDDFNFDLLLKDWQHPHKNWILNIIKNHCYGNIHEETRLYTNANSRYFVLSPDGVVDYGYYKNIDTALYSAEQHIEQLRLELSEQLTNRLYEQLEWLRSDEQIAETLIANEYYFNAETLEIEH